MRNLWSAARAAIAGLLVASAIIGPIPAYAQVIPYNLNVTGYVMPAREPNMRQFPTNQTHYIRTTFTPAMCPTAVILSSVCSFKLGNATLPYNSVVLRIYYAIYVAFNSTTTDSLSLGITQATSTELAVATSIHAIATTAITPVSASINSIGGTAVPTGANGGFDIWARWTYTGASAATAGIVGIIIEYVAPNDATCIVDGPPLGMTSAQSGTNGYPTLQGC